MARRIWVRGWMAGGLALLLAMPVAGGAAETVSMTSAQLDLRDDPEPGLYLNAQFAFEPSAAIEEAIRHGVPVYFAIDFELVRTRWYWFDKAVASALLSYRVSYSPLTRQYRLATGALAQPFDSLADALATLRRVRSWHVADRTLIRPDDDYTAQVRMRLDTSQLPKPFQINALTNRDWTLASDWRNVPVSADLAK